MHYLRLYLYFLRFSFSRAMEFRLDFYFRILMDVAFYVVNLAFFAVIYRHTSMLGGWDLDQIYVFVCGFLLVDAIHMTVFSNNMWWLPIFINRGDLDYYLVRPVSSLFFLSLRDFAANSFINLIIAAGLLVWALARYPYPFGAGALLSYLGFLMGGALVYYLLHVSFLIPVFWIQSHRGLGELFFGLTKLIERPHQVYLGWVRVLLSTILPFVVIASVPAHVLFDGISTTHVAHVGLVIAGLFAFVSWFWGRGLAAYSSASS